jgi:hypothetical protein
MVLATLVLAGGIAWRVAPRAWRQAQLLYWQNKCMNYTAPADRIAYSSDEPITFVADEWSKFYALLSPPGMRSRGTVFLHERVAPNGNRRLVAVDAIEFADPVFQAVFPSARVIIPGDTVRAPREALSTTFTPNFVQDLDGVIYAGQPDPTDPSHFTIRCVENGAEQVVDGWLRDDDSLLLERRLTPPPASSQPAR